MLDIGKRSATARSKCYFVSSTLPGFVNHEQLPTKKRPFCTVLEQRFNHTLDLLTPQEATENLRESLAHDDIGTLRYLTVYMKPSELIEGDFFNEYIKTGNILMLSEGRPGIDHTFSLADGVLRLEVDKPTFERMGLEGKAIPNEGRKHVKARFAIELNLRLPSMIRGKSGFQRVIWAFENVLNETLNWLFHDLKRLNDGDGPIAHYQPKVKVVKPQISTMRAVKVPGLAQKFEDDDYEDATELLEWLTLAIGGSTRIQLDDAVDKYLSRYCIPSSTVDSNKTSASEVQDVVALRWRGFIPAMFIQRILLATLKASGTEWFALSANAFEGKAYTFLQTKDHIMTWEYHD